MSSALARVITLKYLKDLAGERSFQRGQVYCLSGQVQSLVVHGDTLHATVGGTEDYGVRLVARDEGLDHRCSCPVGTEGSFCKHGVAVALAWLGANAKGGGTSKKGRESATESSPLVSLDDLRPWLLGQTPATLTGYLLEAAERDERLREKLLRGAARASAKGIDLGAYRRSVERATRTTRFIDYRSVGSFVEGVLDAVGPIRELLDDTPTQANAVIELAEFALKRVEAAMEQADDSHGELGSLVQDLQDLHLAACLVARPDPEELANRLFDWEINDPWDVFFDAVETYAPVLGETGLAAYRRLAETAWQKLPVQPQDARAGYDSGRFRLTRVMEALARVKGDVDALAAIKAKNLSYPYHYLQIAELYHQAKRADEALAWAERGMKAFPGTHEMRLVEFLADEYMRRNRDDEALTLIWRLFDKRPSLADYQRLKTYADRAGTWPHWRERALTILRQQVEQEAAGPSRRTADGWAPAARAALVQVLLWENDVESAWATGHGHPLDLSLALELAAAREKTHPADALPIYLREVDALIARMGKASYQDAVRRLSHIKALHLRLGWSDTWNTLLARLRQEHKAKRTFIALAAEL